MNKQNTQMAARQNRFKRRKMADNVENGPTSTENDFEIIITDKKIERILKIGQYFDERMFLFERLNGEWALIPTKVANIKYPDEVMAFYEKHLQLENL